MNNKRMIGLTVAIIAGMIIIPTIYKIHENHNEKLLQVVENEFHYYAKECYLNDECTSTVTLKELYEKGYYLGIISNNSIRNAEYILKREGIKNILRK